MTEDFAASVKGKIAQWRLEGLQGLMFAGTKLCGHEELKRGGKVRGCPAMEARPVFSKRREWPSKGKTERRPVDSVAMHCCAVGVGGKASPE